MKKYLFQVIVIYISFYATSLSSQTLKNNYEFKITKEIPVTSVKNQAMSGTCWSFATVSFLEAELIRMGKGEIDLSEMFFVRHAYPIKAELFLRFHGKANFGEGGQAHDVMNLIKKYGLMPDATYTGLCSGKEMHDHIEMEKVIESVLASFVKEKEISPNILKSVHGILDVYLGVLPQKFEYKGKNYDALSFAKEMSINPDDYVELTSYTHHPYYKNFVLEIPDNWSFDSYYNLPMNELVETMKYAIENGYSIAWDGDVSEKSFAFHKGIAILPLVKLEDMTKEEREKAFTEPVKETEVNEELRQTTFNNYSTTDDHLMHITGLAKDKNGTNYFITKNSWGNDGNDLKGYIYMSESFVKLKTVAIMVHKNAIPEAIKKKLKL